MPDLAQAYLHLKPFEVNENYLELGHLADQVAYHIAKQVYAFDVEVSVNLEPGSLRAWITAISAGSVLAVYGAIADYKGFKESVAELYMDAREFGHLFISEFSGQLGVKKDQIFRAERRTKTPGKIIRALHRLEQLEKEVQDLSPKQVQEQIKLIREQLDDGLSDLSTKDEMIARKVIRHEHENRLPEYVIPRLGLRPEDAPSLEALGEHDRYALLTQPRSQLLSPGSLIKGYRNTFRTDEDGPAMEKLPVIKRRLLE